MASVPQRKLEPEISEPAIARSLAATTVAVPKKESPSASISATLSAEEIYRLIQETAYFKAEARHFAPGVELQDWLEAETEVRQRLYPETGCP
jgi:hypothetical protein